MAWQLGVATAALVLLFIACSSLAGCSSAETRYTTALLLCVEKAQTLAESKACRAGVDARFGVDGGAR